LLNGKHGETRSTTRFTFANGPPVSWTLAVAFWKSGLDESLPIGAFESRVCV